MSDTYLFRYDINSFSLQLELHKYMVTKETPAGYWFHDHTHTNKPRWVMRNSRAAFAKPTVEAAAKSFAIRKGKYRARCENRLRDAIWAEKVGEALVAGQPLPLHPAVEAFYISPPVNLWDPTL